MSEQAPKLGVLGAGQLSLMLVEAAKKMKLSTRVFATQADEPATRVSDELQVGSLDEVQSIKKFFQGLDIVALESDFLNFEKLRLAGTGALVPELSVVEKISDKLFQKKLLQELGLPHANAETLKRELVGFDLEGIEKRLGSGLVLKWARGGYDGKGVFIGTQDRRALKEFCELGFSKGYEIFAEQKIDFKREISLVCVLSRSGDWDAYPLVVSQQQNGICRRVWGPAQNFGVSAELEFLARKAAEKIGRHMGLFGTYAVEMFEDAKGAFLINEIAPRVHNTGHFSLSVCDKSQFENHWRALMGLKPEGLLAASNFLMLNLLGTRTCLAPSLPEAELASISELSGLKTEFKCYEKLEMRLGRKMGHINVVGFEPARAREIFSALEKWECEGWQN